MKCGLSGRFELRAVNAKTCVVREEKCFPNMILNSGLDRFWTGDFGSPCPALGVGTSEPSPTDVGLQAMRYEGNYVYTTGSNWIAGKEPDWVSTWKVSWRIPANAAVGTFTEVGVKGFTPGSPFWCRALILDEQGNPSTITVLADEYLDVVYALNFHPNLEDEVSTFEMNGNTYTVTSRPAVISGVGCGGLSGSTGRIYSLTGAGRGGMWATQELGPITGRPSGTGVNTTLEKSYQQQPYEAGSYTKKVLISWGLDQANVAGGIGSIVIDEGNPRMTTQMSFNPKIPKNNTNELSLMFAIRVYRWEGATP